VFVKIRCYADLVFSNYESDWEKIKLFCTPKVLRFAEILLKFQPPELQRNAVDITAKLMSDLEKCDFEALGNKIEDRVNTYEANLKELDDLSGLCDSELKNITNKVDSPEIRNDTSINEVEDKCVPTDAVNSTKNINQENVITSAENDSCGVNSVNSADNKLHSSVASRGFQVSDSNVGDSIENNKTNSSSPENNTDSIVNKMDSSGSRIDSTKFGFSRRSGGRNRGRGRSQRGNTTRAQLTQENPDALCGIIFMREALMAKIMFMLIVVSCLEYIAIFSIYLIM
jgi:hypothetical protein